MFTRNVDAQRLCLDQASDVLVGLNPKYIRLESTLRVRSSYVPHGPDQNERPCQCRYQLELVKE
jgi:hypothetical protein